MKLLDIHTGDCREVLRTLPEQSVHCCVTSPPYFGLRDYGHAGQLGLEETPEQFVANLVEVFRGVRRVLRDDGTLWLNLGDSYAMDSKWGGATGGKHAKALHGGEDGRKERRATGLPDKNLIGIPWRVAFALQADGWYLRQDIIWAKPNPMPESVTDRCTKSHEYLFLLSKSPRYYFDHEAIKEPAVGGLAGNTKPTKAGRGAFRAVTETRNKRSVWNVATRPFKGAHFATFPPSLIEPCILAGCPVGGTVLDPFGGSMTTAMVAEGLGRDSVSIELNPEYTALGFDRLMRLRPGCANGRSPRREHNPFCWSKCTPDRDLD